MRSLRLQLLLSHLALVTLLALVMSGAIRSFFSLSQTIDNVLESNLRGVVTAQQMRDALVRQQSALTLFLAGRESVGDQVFEAGAQDFEAARMANVRASTDSALLSLDEALKIDHATYIDGVQKLFQIDKAQGRDAGRMFYRRTVAPILDRVEGNISLLIQRNQAIIVSANEATKQQARSAFLQSVFFTIAALALAVCLALWMVRLAVTPLATLAKQAEIIGGGDLTRRIELNRLDEIGALADSFNSMASKLAELRKAEIRKLQRAERMSDAALESLYDPVIVTDARMRIVRLNPAAEGLFGPAPTSPRIEAEKHIADRRIIRAIQQAVQREAISASEDETSQVPIQVGGTERTYRLRTTPMRTEDGLVLGAVCVLEDITHLKELDRLKNEFIGVASHELRTPVTSLLLATQLLEEGAAGMLSEKQAKLVSSQRVDLQRLERLLRELLDITRLEAGTAVPRLAIVSVDDLLFSIESAMRKEADAQGVGLTVEQLPGTQVRADREQITRVLVNLVSNALRHTPAGGCVTVRASLSADDVLFCVEDTGEGIPREYLAKIFDRFVQVPGATQGGAGLGLSIAQTIVKNHGGTMTVESDLGRGSRFCFSLRAEKALVGNP